MQSVRRHEVNFFAVFEVDWEFLLNLGSVGQ